MPEVLCTVRNCHQPLAREERRVVCPRGHAFDIARSGYINLLQPQERRSKIPGDSPDAVAARRRFLDRGHAEPLLNAIRSMLPDAKTILDAGCGDGYYLGSLGRGGSGIDISTAAVDLAARRYPDCEWIVTNADRFIPYADASFDLILSITGRMNADEFRRVGRNWLLVAIAAPDDLIELRGKPNRDRVQRTIESFSQFDLVKQERATTVAQLDAEDARDILLATYRPRGGQPILSVGDRQDCLSSTTLSLDLLLFRVSGSCC